MTVPRISLPFPPEEYSAKDQRELRRRLQLHFEQLNGLIVPTQTRPFIYARDLGVAGDGVSDDTIAMNRAFREAAAQRAILYCGKMRIKISGPLYSQGCPGLLFDEASFGVDPDEDPGIIASGTGYTMLSLWGFVSAFNATFFGEAPAQAVNGVITGNDIPASVLEPDADAWDSGTSYAVDDYVTSGGATYICQVANTNQTPVASLGEWDIATPYSIGDHVLYKGSVYRATAGGTGHEPFDVAFWTAAYWSATAYRHVTFSKIGRVRVCELDGFGLQVNDLWDCIIEDISIEKCGNASEYAFSIQSAIGDTSNMSHILRLQVEQSNKRAIYIDPSTLSCVIDNIHSERGTPDAAHVMWNIGAARSVFNAGRFHATGATTTNTRMELHGENTLVSSFNLQDASIVLDGASLSPLKLIQPNFNDSLVTVQYANHSGKILIDGGSIGEIATAIEPDKIQTLYVSHTKIETLTVGDCGNPASVTSQVFDSCRIGTLASGSPFSAARFIDCVIDACGDLLEYRTELIRTSVTNAGTLAGQGAVICDGAVFHCNVTMDSGSSLVGGNGSKVFGNLAQTTDCSSLLDPTWTITGTVTGLGIPTGGPNVGWDSALKYYKGQYHHNYNPAVGDPMGWVCTTTGVDGVYVFSTVASTGSAYPAVSTNTPNTIVLRDGSGNFAAQNVTVNQLIGALQKTLTRGGYLTGGNFNNAADQTWAVDATTAATASKVVARDGSGYITGKRVTVEDGILWFNAALDRYIYYDGTNWHIISGGLNVDSVNAAATIKISGTQVLQSRETGWTALTNTATKGGGYDTTTVTLAQLAAVVKALVDAMIIHGLIGA